MPSTLVSPGAVLRPELAGALAGYAMDDLGLIAHQLAPPMPVPKRNCEFRTIPAAALLSRVNTRRKGLSDASRSAPVLARDTFDIDEYTHEQPIDPTDDTVMATKEQEEVFAARRAMGIVLRDYELVAATATFNTTTFPLSGNTGFSVSTPWSNAASATPIADANRAHEALLTKVGREADTLVITDRGWNDLSNTAQVLERLKYDSGGLTAEGRIPLGALAGIMRVKRVLVGRGRYNTANQGLAVTGTNFWNTDNAFFCVTDSSMDIATPQYARTGVLEVDPESPGLEAQSVEELDGVDLLVEEYAEPKGTAKIIRVKMFRQFKVLNTDCGYLLGNLD